MSVCVCVCRVSERNHLKAEYLLRLVLVLVTFGLAAAIPRLDLFISLVGTGSTYYCVGKSPILLLGSGGKLVFFWTVRGSRDIRTGETTN